LFHRGHHHFFRRQGTRGFHREIKFIRGMFHVHSEFVFGILSHFFGGEQTLFAEDTSLGIIDEDRLGVFIVSIDLGGTGID
jgi:hypothetical protein